MTVSSGGETDHRRSIRSFVIRAGRLTRAQQRALDELWPRFGVEFDARPLDLDVLFDRSAPRVLEIGFGDGYSLAKMAADEPDKDFLGIEVHPPGVGSLLIQIEEHGLPNLRVMKHDAVDVLEKSLPAAGFDRVQIYFADPWPKKKHQKRRIIQSVFVERLVHAMKPGALLHLATDWQDYAEHMRDVVNAAVGLKNLSPSGDFVARPAWRPQTKFETRGQRLGHGVWDLLFERVD
ncbi:MAG: tRNA (guanosine(46)-N7)-methyltransferase TrmB [Gammaproteobacteria bacterium]|nr:tRNA (guanosine(46)-N7)-methyltransferase TrmB [Gammaproteobacteria bacterium]